MKHRKMNEINEEDEVKIWEECDISRIRLSPELLSLQHVFPTTSEDRSRLVESIKRNGIRDPLRGYWSRGKFLLLTGKTRYEIAAELGLDAVPVEPVNMKKKDRIALAGDDNLARRHMDVRTKREAVEHMLMTDPQLSNTLVADRTDTREKNVRGVRKRLERDGIIKKTSHVEGRDGRLYKTGRSRDLSERQKKEGLALYRKTCSIDGKIKKLKEERLTVVQKLSGMAKPMSYWERLAGK